MRPKSFMRGVYATVYATTKNQQISLVQPAWVFEVVNPSRATPRMNRRHRMTIMNHRNKYFRFLELCTSRSDLVRRRPKSRACMLRTCKSPPLHKACFLSLPALKEWRRSSLKWRWQQGSLNMQHRLCNALSIKINDPGGSACATPTAPLHGPCVAPCHCDPQMHITPSVPFHFLSFPFLSFPT